MNQIRIGVLLMIMMISLSGCGISTENTVREDVSKGYFEGYELSDLERVEEEIAGHIGVDSMYAVYKYQVPEDCSKIGLYLQTLESGERVKKQRILQDDFTESSHRNGKLLLVLNGNEVGAMIIGEDETSTTSFVTASVIQAPVNGCLTAQQISGVTNEQGEWILYVLGAGEGSSQEYPRPTEDLQGFIESYDAVQVVLARLE